MTFFASLKVKISASENKQYLVFEKATLSQSFCFEIELRVFAGSHMLGYFDREKTRNSVRVEKRESKESRHHSCFKIRTATVHDVSVSRYLRKICLISIKWKCKFWAYFSVRCVPLIEKILNIVNEREDIATKVEFYVLAGLIYTQSNTSLDNAVKLLPTIESFVDELKLKIVRIWSVLES